MSFAIITPTEEHIASIAPRMRDADVEEVRAASGRSPDNALRHSLQMSEIAWTVTFDGMPELMFGCGTVDILNNIGAPWLLGTDAVERNRRHFLGGSRYWIQQMQNRWQLLRNVVDDRNAASKRWLAWLGFTLKDPEPYGYERLPFRVFEMKVPHV
jgi:hypothetical protein